MLAFLTRSVYGCFIAAIRGEVRKFFDIQGRDELDAYAGCYWPVETLIQTENEIILRQSRWRKESRPLPSTGYTPHSPMTYPSSSSSTSQATTPNTECDEPLPRIPEECSTGAPSSMSSRRTSVRRQRERSIARDPVAPTDATLVNAHRLSQDPTTPAMQKGHSAPHRLSKDPTTPRDPLVNAHELSQDPTSPREPVAPTDATLVNAHRLSQDPTAPAMQKGHSAPHRLSKDPTTPRDPLVNAHELSQDPTTPAMQKGHSAPHRLNEDPASLSHSPPTHHI
ncbi:uncharacterized protein NECHADRAFT_83391 [Fusarium vanettenii 77-13-4]|uniref:Uncharacterized protein n=1 Tax=Fusarium vanettenii (strain ATCC MYA-4622 / CBS 123669 / FGSC 9596 / NRRL 45880 / 77-13-4) TaxID=660122 RepID=C7Z3W4_FUSV7|nr:uncharacterized protein NECHADRAFT_83391 [Fusarium vanettenii 77-13-4]EEU41374.1 predicted protein [Fusarium vanettenii 77-13-4]